MNVYYVLDSIRNTDIRLVKKNPNLMNNLSYWGNDEKNSINFLRLFISIMRDSSGFKQARQLLNRLDWKNHPWISWVDKYNTTNANYNVVSLVNEHKLEISAEDLSVASLCQCLDWYRTINDDHIYTEKYNYAFNEIMNNPNKNVIYDFLGYSTQKEYHQINQFRSKWDYWGLY